MKKKDFADLKSAVRDMVANINKEKTPAAVGARVTPVPAGIRAGLEMTQQEFAALIGVSVRTVQDWEVGRRKPDGAAKSLLRVAAYRPDIVLEALRSA
jgi:putative transcriptional regulator